MSNTATNTPHYDTASVFVAVICRPQVGKNSPTHPLGGGKMGILPPQPPTTRTPITRGVNPGPHPHVFSCTPPAPKPRPQKR